MGVNLKEQINNALGDEMRKVEMDVTSSFLNGKICSPLVSGAITTLDATNATVGNIANTAAAAGLYITKDGLQFDPSAMTDLASSILNIAIETSKNKLMDIRNKAWNDITELPDPSLITNSAISYFSYYISNSIDMDAILNFTPAENKVEELNENKKNNVMNKVSYFMEQKLPMVTEKITNTQKQIEQYCSYATYYAAFGPSWLSDKISKGIDDASYFVEKEVTGITGKFRDFKTNLYIEVGNELGEQMSKQYEKLLRDQIKTLNNEVETNKSKVLIKAQGLLQQASLKIMSKTGIKIPIEKITPENLSKVKQTAKIAKLINMASGGTTSSSNNTEQTKPADETTVLTDKQKLIQEMNDSIASHRGYEDPETGQWMVWDDELNKYVPTHTLQEVDITPSTYTEKEVMNLMTQQESFMSNPPLTTV